MESKINKNKLDKIDFYNLNKKMISKHFRIKSDFGNFIRLYPEVKEVENKTKKDKKFWNIKNNSINRIQINRENVLGNKIFTKLKNYKEKFNLINKEIRMNSNTIKERYSKYINKNKNFIINNKYIKKKLEKKINKNETKSLKSENVILARKKTFFDIAKIVCMTKGLKNKFSSIKNINSYKTKNIILNKNLFQPDNNELCTLDYVEFDNTQYLVLFGGINNYKNEEIYYFNWKLNIWKKHNFKNNFLSRYGHSSCVYNNKLIIYFAGQKNINIKQEKNYLYYSDLRILNFETLKINSFNIVSKNYPKARKFHSSCLRKNEIYIFGGSDYKQNILNDIWKGIINFKNKSIYWSKIYVIKNDIGFYKHSIFTIDDYDFLSKNKNYNGIFLFGGIDENYNLHNKLYFYKFNIKDSYWKPLEIKGNIPNKIYGFKGNFNKYWESIIIFGGKDNKGNIYNNLYLLNLNKKLWIQINFVSYNIIKRYSFGLAIQKNNIYIFGGIDNENQLRGHLEKIKINKV